MAVPDESGEEPTEAQEQMKEEALEEQGQREVREEEDGKDWAEATPVVEKEEEEDEGRKGESATATVLSFRNSDIVGKTLVVRPEKFVDYDTEFRGEHAALIIDNGSFCCRMGWANESSPRLNFRSVVSRPRVKATGQTVTVVGDCDANSARGLEFSKATSRSPFDTNVVYNFELLEHVFDYGFDRLGLSGGRVDHPVLVTEPPCCPLYSRSRMAELMFETYGVPALGLGSDAMFSFNYNANAQSLPRSGLVVSAGHWATHVIPVLSGNPIWEGCCRIPVGGGNCTEYLRSLLSVLYPQHLARLTWERVEEMKTRSCYVAQDYSKELKEFQDQDRERANPAEAQNEGRASGEGQAVLWQLPFTPPPVPVGPTEEELARRAAVKERAAQRLRDMAAAKRAAKVAELEGHVAALEAVKDELELLVEGGAEEAEAAQLLRSVRLSSKEQLDGELRKAMVAMYKAKGEEEEASALMKEDPGDLRTMEEKYPLLSRIDSELSPEELKEKRRQRLLKAGEESRMKAKQKAEEERQKEQERKDEEDRRYRDNPELYLAQLRDAFLLLQKESLQRKQGPASTNPNANTSAGAGPGTAQGDTGLGAGSILASDSTSAPNWGISSSSRGVARRGERITAAHRERMKLLTSAASEVKGKKRRKGDSDAAEDDFGARDEDWEVYKRMSVKRGAGGGGEEEEEQESAQVRLAEAELGRLTARLRELDPDFLEQTVGPEEDVQVLPSSAPVVTEAHFQIRLGVERIRTPELLFEPSMIGQYNGGIGSTLASVMRRCPDSSRQAVMDANFVFFTGGSSCFPGFLERVLTEFRMLRPIGAPVSVVGALDPVLDAWKGAQEFSCGPQFQRALFTRAEYLERGSDWFRTYVYDYN